jgi:hypothetical protein
VRLALALVLAVSLAVSGDAGAAKKKPAKRAKIVCFKKKGKKVCRPKRKPAKRVAPAPVALPIPAAPLAPAGGQSPVAASPSSASSPQGTDPLSVVAPVKPDCGTSPWVGYTAADVNGVFKLTGTRTCVPGPNVLFQLRNVDAQDHNLYAEGIAPAAPSRAVIANVLPGETEDAGVALTAGEWRLYCDIEGHESMSRTLTVTG